MEDDRGFPKVHGKDMDDINRERFERLYTAFKDEVEVVFDGDPGNAEQARSLAWSCAARVILDNL